MKNVTIKFHKMTGAGNDFIVIDNRDSSYDLDWKTIAPKLSDRRYGIGSDGLIILGKSDLADFKMDYYNADGSYGGMCGNGGRCSSLYIMQEAKKTEINFEALNHVYEAILLSDNVILHLLKPNSILINQEDSKLFNMKLNYHFVNTGSPHAVILYSEQEIGIQKLMSTDFTNFGRILRESYLFQPGGANINVAQVKSDRFISMRTYERGVEDETLACGTGSAACAIIYSMIYDKPAPIKVQTRSNEILEVNFDIKEGQIENLTLNGPALAVFRGEITIQV